MAQGQNPQPTLTQGVNYSLLLKEECMLFASEVVATVSALNPWRVNLYCFSGNFCQLQTLSQVVSSYLQPETYLLDENG